MNKEDRNFLNKTLNVYLEPMLIEYLAIRPSDPVILKKSLLTSIVEIYARLA